MATATAAEPRTVNQPLDGASRANEGYRFENLEPGDGNSDEVFVCLAFSGGGVRAAAMAYGVLDVLRQTHIKPLSGPDAESGAGESAADERTLLDEVDVISASSFGAMTAMYYGVNRDEMFNADHFYDEVLRRKYERSIGWSMWNPFNWCALATTSLDRIDLAARLYSEDIYDGASYGALLERGDRPFVVVNATNVASGQRFEFTQDDFDLLGSDLATFPVGDAIAASSAYPVVFTPLRLAYHGQPAEGNVLRELLANEANHDRDPRRVAWARDLVRDADDVDNRGVRLRKGQPMARPETDPFALDTEDHRYLYLLDGGLAGNLGLPWIIESTRFGPIRERIDDGRTRHLVVIVVNAGSGASSDIEQDASAPGLMHMAYKAAAASVDNYADAELQMMQLVLEQVQQAESARTASRDLNTWFIEVTHRDLQNAELRSRYAEIPTRLQIDHEHVDLAAEVARELLRTNPAFQHLVGVLGSDTDQRVAAGRAAE